MEYKLIMHRDIEIFEEMIEDYLYDGYTLVGGPFLFNGDEFCQAVTRS